MVLSVLIVADSVFWFVACQRLEAGARDAAMAAGWILDSQPARWSGWPGAAEIRLDGAMVRTGPGIVPAVAWTIPRLTLQLTPWSPTQVRASAAGRQSLAIGATAPVAFVATALTAQIDLTTPTPPRLEASDIVADTAFGPVRAATAALTVAPDGWSAMLAGVTVPGRNGRVVTPPVDDLRLDGRFEPPVEPQVTARQSAQTWRDRGGRLSLSLSSLRWGALAASGQFTLTLDPALQPVVDGTLMASGLSAALQQLSETGAITSAGNTAAQAMLLILSAPLGTAVRLPVTVEDGIVTVARFPLLRLQPLQWD